QNDSAFSRAAKTCFEEMNERQTNLTQLNGRYDHELGAPAVWKKLIMHMALEFCQPPSRSAPIADYDQNTSLIRDWLVIVFVLPKTNQHASPYVLGKKAYVSRVFRLTCANFFSTLAIFLWETCLASARILLPS